MLNSKWIEQLEKEHAELLQKLKDQMTPLSGHTTEVLFKLVDGKVMRCELHYREFGVTVPMCEVIDLP